MPQQDQAHPAESQPREQQENAPGFSGVLNLYKPVGKSSAHYVYRLRNILGVRKIGHAGTLDPFAHGVLLLRIDDVGRAELAREIELTRHRVDGDDTTRAGNRGPIDAGETYAAATDHCDRCAGFDFRGVDHRADPGRNSAADQRRAVERHIRTDLHDRVLVHQHTFGE